MEDLISEILRMYDQGNFSLSNTSTSNKLEWDIPNSMFFAATIATTIGECRTIVRTMVGNTMK